MLAMTSVIVDYTFNIMFLTFYILQVPPPIHCGARSNLPSYSPARWEWVL